MKVSELAKQLNTSESTIYRLLRKGIIDAEIKPGNSKFTPNRIKVGLSGKSIIKSIENKKEKLDKQKEQLDKKIDKQKKELDKQKAKLDKQLDNLSQEEILKVFKKLNNLK